jgi:hypothetical protein
MQFSHRSSYSSYPEPFNKLYHRYTTPMKSFKGGRKRTEAFPPGQSRNDLLALRIMRAWGFCFRD